MTYGSDDVNPLPRWKTISTLNNQKGLIETKDFIYNAL